MRTAFYQLTLYINTCTEHDLYYMSAVTILKNINKIPMSSITDVADMCFVSPSTISRLCRKLNFTSFIDFKEKVSDSITNFNNTYEHTYIPNYSIKDLDSNSVMDLHHSCVINNINSVHETLEYDKINKLIEMIHQSKKIIFLGYYYSQMTSMQLQIELGYLNKECYGLFDEQSQNNLINSTTFDDLIIIVSMTGRYISESTECIRSFKNSKAKKVLISQDLHSLNHNDLDLYINFGNNNDSLISKFALTYLFETIEMLYHLRYNK